MLKLLFVSPVSPFACASGAEQRSNLMRQALACLGDVDVLQLSHGARSMVQRQPMPESDTYGAHTLVVAELAHANLALNRFAPKPAFTRQVEAALGRAMVDYDAVVGRYVWPICQLDIPSFVPKVVDLDDWCYRTSPQARWTIASMQSRLVKGLTHVWNRRQLSRFAAAWAVSVRDAQALQMLPVALLPNVSFSQPTSESIPGPVHRASQVLFVGSLWYRPNQEGVDWFLRCVWPQVLAVEPRATLLLVGAAPPSVRARWAQHSGVHAPGFVDDLAATYQNASMVIVPIHTGGGSNIKVLEALAHGRPCVVTGLVHGAFADHLRPGAHVLVADAPSDFANQVLAVLQAPERFTAMAAAGQIQVQTAYSRQRFESSVQCLVRSMVAERKNTP
jgi:glycosyltransferase involved in cell wall biosynthesis